MGDASTCSLIQVRRSMSLENRALRGRLAVPARPHAEHVSANRLRAVAASQ